MTALSQYERLEAVGIWRETPEAQRREVIVSFGDATLVILDQKSNRPLTHWSLAALVRRNPGKTPALYAPSDELGEELEIEDPTMVDAVDRLQAALESRKPHPGRLRGMLIWGGLAATLVGGAFWLPGAVVEQAARVVPAAKRVEIGQAILADLARTTGSSCHSTGGDEALIALIERLPGQDQIAIVRRGVEGGIQLPGAITVVGRRLVTSVDTPEVIAGALITAHLAAEADPPFLRFLKWAGVSASARLLVTGALPANQTEGYGKVLLDTPSPQFAPEDVLAAFSEAGVSATPYAYAVDPTGEATLPLIEGDPFKGVPAPRPVLDDAQWIALQDICD